MEQTNWGACHKDIAKTTTKYHYHNSGILHSFIHLCSILEKIVQETQLHRENTDWGAQCS